MNHQEFNAVEGLLSLYSYPSSSSSQMSLQSYGSEYSVRLNPISPTNDSAGQRLPSIAQVLSSSPTDTFGSPASSTCSLNMLLSTPVCPSMTSSCSSSTTSSISSSFSDYIPQQATRKTLRRTTACTFPANRRGRPRKNPNTATTTSTNATTTSKKGSKNKKKDETEIKIIKSEYEKVAAVTAATTVATNLALKTNAAFVPNKPRWQDSERQTLIEVIVQEKELDNMSTIPWDKVSKVVGRAKKACQDQWRREILPHLLKGLVRQPQGCFEGGETMDKQ